MAIRPQSRTGSSSSSTKQCLRPSITKGEPLGQELIASIAGLLSASTIPNVLWGNYMLIVHGVPSVVEVF